MRILLTGGNGFLGRNLIDELSKYNNRIRVLVRTNDNIEGLKRYNLEFFYGDMTDKESLVDACKDVDLVIHMAAIIQDRGNYKELHDVHVNGATYLIEACKKNKIKRVVVVSSMATKNKHPDNYGKTKLKADRLFKESGLSYTILRPSLIYGKNGLAFSNMIKQLNMFPFFIPIVGDGKYKINPVYVKDVVSAILNCVKTNRTIKKEYDIVGKEDISFNEFVDTIAESINIKKIKIHIPYFICYILALISEKIMTYPVLTRSNVLNIKEDKKTDISDAVRDFGYNPISFREGIKYAV